MKNILLTILLLCLFCTTAVIATEDYYPFAWPQDQQRFQTLTTQLRCLVCQNQNIAESNASLAADLRQQIYQQIQQGKTNQEIINYLIARYGHFILYKPPIQANTIGLWATPFVLLLFGIGYLLWYLRHQRTPQA